MPEYDEQDVEYQLWWNDHDKYAYHFRTLEGVNETIEKAAEEMEYRWGITLDRSLIRVKSRVTIKQSSEWTEDNQFKV